MSPKRITIVLSLVWLGLLLPSTAQAIVVEKVAAVVGEKAILLTELRQRAAPFLIQMYRKVPEGAQRAASESRMLAQLLERMVDEELESAAALRTNTTVSSEDVDKALKNMARTGGMSLSQLFEDVRLNSGLSEQAYRQEIRRQVLEGKLLQRLVQNRFRITEQDLTRMFDEVRRQERGVRQFNPAWIVLRKAVGDPQREALAREISQRARAGEDFAALASEYSDDAPTRDKGGNLGIRAPAQSAAALSGQRPILAASFEKVVMKLEPEQVSDPVKFKKSLVVFKLVSRQPSRYTTVQEAQPELIQRVKAEQLEKAKKKWLEDLRRRTHVEVRL